ncbi:MAG: phage holin family protein [Candidatus Peribacteraceae bacterium]
MAHRGSLPLRILLKTLLNILVVWLMATYLNQYFQLAGGPAALVIVGILLTLMNMFVRPVLEILTLPFKLFATIIAVIIVNGGFVQLTHMITQKMDPSLVQLEIFGGLWGWIVVATAFGFSNWIIKEVLHPKGGD